MAFNNQRGNQSFYISSLNALNLALPNRTYYKNAQPYSDSQYKLKISGLRDIIKQASTDILALQEVWDKQAFQTLAQSLGFNPDHVLAPQASNDMSSSLTGGLGAQGTPGVGLVSKFKVLEWSLLTDFDTHAVIDIPDQGLYTGFNRSPLVVTYDIHGHPVTVITAHLKSKRPHYLRDDSGKIIEDYDNPQLRVRAKLRSLYMRGAEAAALRLFIIKRLQHTRHPLILLGDMNDVTDSVTTQLMAETSEVTYDKAQRDFALFDAAKVQTSYGWMNDVAYTHIYQGIPEVIDQLFVSEEFVPDSKFSLGSVEKVDYFNDHLKSDVNDRVSDHGLVRAKIRLQAK